MRYCSHPDFVLVVRHLSCPLPPASDCAGQPVWSTQFRRWPRRWSEYFADKRRSSWEETIRFASSYLPAPPRWPCRGDVSKGRSAISGRLRCLARLTFWRCLRVKTAARGYSRRIFTVAVISIIGTKTATGKTETTHKEAKNITLLASEREHLPWM